MQSWSEWSAQCDRYFSQRRIAAFDLDDTLTEHGSLAPAVHLALQGAQKKGWRTVLVTGRPAGWADALIKLLPFDAVIAENGAIIFNWAKLKAGRGPREEPQRLYWNQHGYGDKVESALAERQLEARTRILSAVPKARVASDQPYRIYDLAIDFAEEVDPPLSLKEAAKIRDLFQDGGATAKISSIHVNGWWGAFSKERALRELVEKLWQLSLEKNVIYVGDSPNDGPLFASAGLSVGVANVQKFVGDKDFTLPNFVTQYESGQGALEVLAALGSVKI